MVRLLMNHRLAQRRFDSARAAARRSDALNPRPPPAHLAAQGAAFGGCIHRPRLVRPSGGRRGPAAAAKVTHPVGAVARDDL